MKPKDLLIINRIERKLRLNLLDCQERLFLIILDDDKEVECDKLKEEIQSLNEMVDWIGTNLRRNAC